MATINDLYLDDNGFIACKENQTSKEWDILLTELFKDWQELQAELKQAKAEAWDECQEVCRNYYRNEFNEPTEPTNPYKEEEEREPPTWEHPEAWADGFADNH